MIGSVKYMVDSTISAEVDGVTLYVPDEPANRYRQLIAEWEAEGGVIAPYEPPPLTQADYTAAIAAHLDATAKQRNYDSALSIATYVGSAVPQWAGEAAAYHAWRDQVWVYVYAHLAAVLAGEREQPTVADLLAELPVIAWPEAAPAA